MEVYSSDSLLRVDYFSVRSKNLKEAEEVTSSGQVLTFQDTNIYYKDSL
jgi:hypothetical protein